MQAGDNGFRAPTAREQSYVVQLWSGEIAKRYRANGGKVLVALAIAGLVLLILDILIAPSELLDKVLLAGGCSVCLRAGLSQRKRSKAMARRLELLAQNRFSVMSARAQHVRTAGDRRHYNGYVQVLAGGRTAEYRMPYRDAAAMEAQNNHQFPVLLVLLEGEQEVLALLAPAD